MPIRNYRRMVEWTFLSLYLLIPFFRIHGESVLRFDVPTLRLHFFGTTIWVQDFFFVLLFTIFVLCLFIFLTFLFGRVWCGWSCPQTILCDLTSFLNKTKQTGLIKRVGRHVAFLVISLVLGFATVSYFVSPYELISKVVRYKPGSVSVISILVLGILFYLNLCFLRRLFCITICPYSKIQGLLTDDKSLVIKMDPTRESECIQCKSCVRVCPTGIDIRKGMDIGCIMCAECIDACKTVMAQKNKEGFVGYYFGVLSETSFKTLVRPTLVSIGLAALLVFIALFHQLLFRSPLDFVILPHPMEARFTKEEGVINAYILSIKNKGRENILLSLRLGKGNEAGEFNHSIADYLAVPAGMVEKFPLFIRSRTKLSEDRKIEVVLSTKTDIEKMATKSVYFLVPISG